MLLALPLTTSYDCIPVILDAEEMFTYENDRKLMNWLDVAIKMYRDLVDKCVDVTAIFTKEMWIEQAGGIQVKIPIDTKGSVSKFHNFVAMHYFGGNGFFCFSFQKDNFSKDLIKSTN